jgi:hypothetical protein
VGIREVATVRFRDQDSGELGIVIVRVDAERRMASLTTSLRRDGDIQANLDAGALEQVMRALMEARHQIGDEPTELNVPAPEAFISVIRTIVDCLAVEDYEGALETAPTTRMSAQNLADSIKDYGARIVPIPEHGLRQLEMTRVETAEISTWHVSVPIWTVEEGRSDLTLELWVKHLGHGLYGAEMLDLHVL